MPASPSHQNFFAISQSVVAGVGDMVVSDNAGAVISTYALGSCVGVVAYEARRKVGGILHLMLPESRIAPAKATGQPAMFADTGLPLFFQQLASFGVRPPFVRLYLAGGANVIAGSDPFRIGQRNAQATQEYLKAHGFPVLLSDLGGSVNRTLHLELATGLIRVKKPGNEEQFSLV